MKTTVDIPEDLLRDAQEASGSTTIRQTVTLALEEYVRIRRSRELVGILGTFTEFMDRDELARDRGGK